MKKKADIQSMGVSKSFIKVENILTVSLMERPEGQNLNPNI